jgi:hypothetical protein
MSPSNGKLTVFGLFLFALLTAPASAYSSVISMEHSVGFNGHFQLKKWAPITVVLENRGSATNGQLEVVVTSGSELKQNIYQTTYAMEVELPYNSKKVFAFTVLINTYSHQLLIRFRQNGSTLLSNAINLRPYYTENHLVVVADRKISPDFLSVLPQSLYPVSVRARYLPEDWYGYNSVKLFIISPDTLKDLREKQFEALTQWVDQGGCVVVTSITNYGSLLAPRTQRLLPVKLLGHKQFVELKSLERFCSQKLSATTSFLVLDARVQGGEVLLKEDTTPIITAKPSNQGKIIFLSLNFNKPPFNSWDGRQAFWEKVLVQTSRGQIEGLDVNHQKILAAMLASMPAHFPDFKLIVLFLAAYLFLARFFIKRLEKYSERRRKYSYCLMGTVLIFSAAGYFMFYYPNHMNNFAYSSFSQLTVIDKNKVSSGKSVIGVYALSSAEYAFSIGSQSVPVTHALYEKAVRKKPSPYLIREAPSGRRIAGTMNRWSHEFFMTEINIENPFSAQVRLDQQHLSIAVENKSPHEIKNCLIYFKERFIYVGKIPAQRVAEKKIKLSDLKRLEFFSPQQAHRIVNQMIEKHPASLIKEIQSEGLANLLVDIHMKYQSEHARIYLLGWIQAGAVHINFEKADAQAEDLTLIKWEIPVGTT